jgi:hypothetical protein
MVSNRIIASFITVLLATVLFGFIRIDTDPIKKIEDQLNKWATNYPQEKVYLQLDKSYYATGDDIWFKAYVTIGSEHQLSALSGLLNVELINDKDSIEKAIKLPLTKGLAWGDFALPDTMKGGNYRIRAYTNWMRNTGPGYFFDKTILIGSAANIITKTISHQPASKTTDVQFFPESGSLVNGIRSRVAFKAIGPDGKGVDIKGEVTDDQNHRIATFNSQHLGMGSFYLSPEKGKTYKALIIYPDGTQNNIRLPMAINSGFVLAIDDQDIANIKVAISATHDLLNETNELTLIAQSGGQIYYASKNKINAILFTSAIPKSKFPPGIVQFTLFNGAGEPLNERIVFIPPGCII